MYLTLDEIARRLKTLMDCTQTEMADRLDVQRAAVSQALSGESRQRRTLFRIAEELGCAVDAEPHYLFKLPSKRDGGRVADSAYKRVKEGDASTPTRTHNHYARDTIPDFEEVFDDKDIYFVRTYNGICRSSSVADSCEQALAYNLIFFSGSFSEAVDRLEFDREYDGIHPSLYMVDRFQVDEVEDLHTVSLAIYPVYSSPQNSWAIDQLSDRGQRSFDWDEVRSELDAIKEEAIDAEARVELVIEMINAYDQEAESAPRREN